MSAEDKKEINPEEVASVVLDYLNDMRKSVTSAIQMKPSQYDTPEVNASAQLLVAFESLETLRVKLTDTIVQFMDVTH